MGLRELDVIGEGSPLEMGIVEVLDAASRKEALRRRFGQEVGFAGFADVRSYASLAPRISPAECELQETQGIGGVGALRLQLGEQLGFADVQNWLAFFNDLGIQTLYFSPIVRGDAPYSTTHPDQIDPALGTEDEFDQLCGAMRALGMNIMLDTVPNHMSARAETSPWWADVLENGRVSQYWRVFDMRPDADGKFTIPILGAPPDQLWMARELQVGLHPSGAGIRFNYWDNRLPLNSASVGESETWEQLMQLANTDYRYFQELWGKQHYNPRYWKEAECGFRRFFDITRLVGVRIEDPVVFEMTHQLIFHLFERYPDVVKALRVDHADGPLNTGEYLERLQARISQLTGQRPYVVVEKILGPNENLPKNWLTDGETGYEGLNTINQVLIDRRGYDRLVKTYNSRIGDAADIAEVTAQQKLVKLRSALGAEVSYLSGKLLQLIGSRSLTLEAVCDGLLEVTARLPRYRTYIDSSELVYQEDIEAMLDALAQAEPKVDPEVFEFICDVLFLNTDDIEEKRKMLDFVMEWQQVTGPAMARGFEDTVTYRFNALGSALEVGSHLTMPQNSVDAFHDYNKKTLASHPLQLVTDATHDTKRGADARAHMDVISEIPELWFQQLEEWERINQKHLVDTSSPDLQDRYTIYQNLAAVLPLDRELVNQEFIDRMLGYIEKATREAGRNTSWGDQNWQYESATRDFIGSILSDQEFLDKFMQFRQLVALHGSLNSLSQVALKMTSVGVSETYWMSLGVNDSLVDPDNRRGVNLSKLEAVFRQIQGVYQESPIKAAGLVLDRLTSDQAKIFMNWQTWQLRRRHLHTMNSGSYIPLEPDRQQDNVVAFARFTQGDSLITIVPRLTTNIVDLGRLPLGEQAWGDTQITLPASLGRKFRNIFTGEEFVPEGNKLKLAQVFQNFPVAVLERVA